MSNTAKKYEFNHPIVDGLLGEHKAQGVVSNLILKQTEELLLQRSHWETLMGQATSDEQKERYVSLMAEIDTIMMAKQQISSAVYGAKESDLDAIGMPPVTKKPETNNNPAKPEGKVKDLIPNLGKKPAQKVITDTVKAFIKEGKVEQATKIAKKYFGGANYTPKKSKSTAETWSDERIDKWIKQFVKQIGTKTEKSESNNAENLKKVGVKEEDLEEFGTMCDTLEEETKVLDDFSTQYQSLMKKGSEDKEAAKILVEAFFENRLYHESHRQAWLESILDDNNTEADHWKYLGVPGKKEGLLGDAPSYKEMEEKVIGMIKDKKDKETICASLSADIIGHVVLDDKNHNYEIYTILHARDFVSNLYDENIGKHKPKEDNSKNVSKEKPAQKDTPTDTKSTTEKQKTVKNVPSESGSKEEKSKNVNSEDTKPLPEQQLEALMLKSIRNGGVISDILFIPEVENLVNTGLRTQKGTQEFKDMDEVTEAIKPIFENVFDRYDNNRKGFPFGAMMGNIRLQEENDIPVKDCVKDNIDLIQKRNGEFIPLTENKKEGDILLESEEDFTKFVKDKYAYFKQKREDKAEADKKRVEELKEKGEKLKKESEKENLKNKVDKRLEEIENKKAEKKSEKPQQQKKFKLKKFMKDIKSVNEITPHIKAMLNAGAQDQEVKEWAYQKVMNKELEGINDPMKTKEQINVLIEGIIRSFSTEEKTNLLTEDEIVNEIKELWLQEDVDRQKVYKKMKTHLAENNTKMSVNDLMGLIMSNKPEDIDTNVKVIEKVSETNKELYDICKEFTSLDELFNQIKEMKEKGEWEDAKALAIELIAENNQITEADGWNTEQVSDWFEKMFNSETNKENEENIEDAKVVEDENDSEESNSAEWDFSNVISAGDKNKFKQAMQEFVTNNEMTNECRKALAEVIMKTANDKSAGSHVRKVAKSGAKALHNTINNTVEKHKKATK